MIQIIRENCERYRRAVYQPDGSISINHDQTRNQIFDSLDLQNLSHSDLQMTGFYLAKMSYNKNMNAIIENDHIEYWCHVANLARNNTRLDRWIRSHNPIFSFVDSQLINRLKPLYQDHQNKLRQNLLLSELTIHGFFPSVWSGFAFLEGVCRRICKDYITPEGKIKKPFKVKGSQYRSELGNTKCKKKNKGKTRISNLSHVLELSRRIVDSESKNTLNKFFGVYTTSEIFDWRNSCLHGAEDRETVIIALYSLISMLILDSLKNA